MMRCELIVISVTLVVPAEHLGSFLPVIERLVHASRREEGVLAYTFARDLLQLELIRIFEVYRDRAAFDAHTASTHFQAWRPLSAPYLRQERFLMEAARI